MIISVPLGAEFLHDLKEHTDDAQMQELKPRINKKKIR